MAILGVSMPTAKYPTTWDELRNRLHTNKNIAPDPKTTKDVAAPIESNNDTNPIGNRIVTASPNTTVGKIKSGIEDPGNAIDVNKDTLTDYWKKIYEQLAGSAPGSIQNVGAIGGGTGGGGLANTGAYGDTYNNQKALGDLLLARVNGTAPSQSVIAAQGAQDQNLAQMAALNAAAPRSALTQRNLQNEQALSGQKMARDLAVARLNEQQGAQTSYGSLLGQMGSQSNQRDIANMDDNTKRVLAEYEAKVRQMEAQAKLNQALAGGIFSSAAGALGSIGSSKS
jgi:hypothetical protein